jgi:hypothetical protein
VNPDSWQIFLVGFVAFVAGILLGLGLSKRKNLFQEDLDWPNVFWAFSDIPGEKFFAELNLREFRKLQNTQPTFLTSLLQGNLHQKCNEGQKAYRIHRSLLSHSGNSQGAKEILPVQILLDLYAQDRFEEAYQEFKKLPRKWRKSAPLRGVLGLIQQKLGQQKDSSATFRSLCKEYPQAVFLREKFHAVYLGLGECFLREKQWAKAQKVAHEVLSHSPFHPQALLLRTDLALAEKDWHRAEMTLLQLAQSQDPGSRNNSLQSGSKWHSPSAVLGLMSRIQILINEKKEINPDLRALLPLDPKNSALRLFHETHA